MQYAKCLKKYYNAVDGTFSDAIIFFIQNITYYLPNKIAYALRQFLVDDNMPLALFKFFFSISTCCFILKKVTGLSRFFV